MSTTDTWTGSAGTDDFSNSKNWNNGVPISGDDVVIPFSSTVNINGNDTDIYDLHSFEVDYDSIINFVAAAVIGVTSSFTNNGTINLDEGGEIFANGGVDFNNYNVINVENQADLRIFSGKIDGGGSVAMTGGSITGINIENDDNNISGYGAITCDADNPTADSLKNDAGGIVNAVGGQLSLSSQGKTIINLGVIEAGGADGQLVVNDAIANTGTIGASNGGYAQIDGGAQGGTITAKAGGVLLLDGASNADILAQSANGDSGPSQITVRSDISGCTLDADGIDKNGNGATIFIDGFVSSGSILRSENGGLFVAENGGLDGTSAAVTNTARLVVDEVDDVRNQLEIDGTILNKGSIVLDAPDAPVALMVGSDGLAGATLEGGGSIILSNGGHGVIDGVVAKQILINYDNTISGNGFLGQGNLLLDNKALIDATGGSPFFVDLSTGSASINKGTMEATGGGDLQFIAGLFLNSATIAAGADSSAEFGKSADITNKGVVEAVRDGFVTIGAADHNAKAFNNQGRVEAHIGSTVTVGADAIVNMSGKVLTGGVWGAYGNGASLNFADSFTSDKSTLILDGVGSVIRDGGIVLETALTDIAAGGTLSIQDGRSYTTSRAMTVEGTLQLAGTGMVKTGALTAAAGSTISGTGTLASDLTSKGAVEAIGGTLTLTGVNTLVGSTIAGGGTLALKGTTGVTSLKISGGTSVSIYGKIAVNGTITLGVKSGTATTAGRLLVQSGGTLDLSGSASVAAVSGSVTNAGTLEKTGAGTAKIGLSIANGGRIIVGAGILDAVSSVTATGKAVIENGGTLEFDAAVASTQAISFGAGGGELLLEKGSAFAGSIGAFGTGDTLDLGHFGKGTTFTYTENAQKSGGTLAVKNGTTTVKLVVVGNNAPSGFHLTNTSIDSIFTYTAPPAAVAKAATPATVSGDGTHLNALTTALFDAAFGHAPISTLVAVAPDIHGATSAALTATPMDASAILGRVAA